MTYDEAKAARNSGETIQFRFDDDWLTVTTWSEDWPHKPDDVYRIRPKSIERQLLEKILTELRDIRETLKTE